MTKKSIARLSFSLLLLVAALSLSFPQPAEAACWYPRTITTTYYAWIDNYDPTWYSCHYIIISPAWQAHWGVIGERTVDCDGTVYEWGDTTTCTGPDNTERDSSLCDPICE